MCRDRAEVVATRPPEPALSEAEGADCPYIHIRFCKYYTYTYPTTQSKRNAYLFKGDFLVDKGMFK